MSTPETYDDLLNEMYGNRKAVIESLHFYNGEANSKDIREEGGIPRGSKHDLLSRLSKWEIIEKVGSEPAGKGGHADVYRLTDLGQQICEDIVDRTTTVDDLEEITETIQRLDKTVKEHEEALQQLEEQLEGYDDLMDTLEAYLREQM